MYAIACIVPSRLYTTRKERGVAYFRSHAGRKQGVRPHASAMLPGAGRILRRKAKQIGRTECNVDAISGPVNVRLSRFIMAQTIT